MYVVAGLGQLEEKLERESRAVYTQEGRGYGTDKEAPFWGDLSVMVNFLHPLG